MRPIEQEQQQRGNDKQDQQCHFQIGIGDDRLGVGFKKLFARFQGERAKGHAQSNSRSGLPTSHCTYAADSDWLFASDRLFGKMPIWANTSLQKVLQPAARRAGITKQIGWHTFRHTYSSLLAESGDDVKVVQELMRHAKVSTTMEIYTQARMSKRRAAQSRAVGALFSRQRAEVRSNETNA